MLIPTLTSRTQLQMDSTLNPLISLIISSHTLILLGNFWLHLPFVNSSNSDYSFLYKKCANQTLLHPQTLSSLFQELLAESSHSKFFETVTGDENLGISALFQCRGDLRHDECYNCVNRLPNISNTLCNQAVAARIQLDGCYFRYEADGFTNESEAPPHELLHQACSRNKVVAGGGFEEVRNAAFAAVESGVMVSSDRFFQTDYEYMHVMAQCEGSLGGCDCGECVSLAVQIAEEKCGSSISGQVYLDQCSLRYTYHLDGVQGNSYPEGGGNGNNTGKTAAIVLGGAAALVVGLIFLRILRKSCSKNDDIE